MDTERPPTSHLGGFGATFAIVGVAVVYATVALIVLFFMFLGGASVVMLGVMAALGALPIFGLWVVYVLSGSLR
jgi:hypothetical protein